MTLAVHDEPYWDKYKKRKQKKRKGKEATDLGGIAT